MTARRRLPRADRRRRSPHGWRFAGLHATADGARRPHAPRRPGRRDPARDRRRPRTGRRRRSSTSRRRPAGTSARRTTSTASRFAGHEPLRPLVDHDPRARPLDVPVRGHDAYQVAVGPIHAGVIESGHFRFHVVGDRILHLDARLFYKHRGLERAAEGKTLDEGARLRLRAPAPPAPSRTASPTPHACEDALGLVPTAELARARTILLELERTWSHLNDIAADLRRRRPGRRQHQLRRAHRARAPAQRHAHRPPLPLRHRPRRRQRARRSTRERPRRPRRARRAARGRGARLARAALQHLVPGPPARHRRRHGGEGRPARRRRPGGPRGRARARTSARDSAAARLRRLRAAVPERAAGDVQARLEQRALELWQSLRPPRRACSTARVAPAVAEPRRGGARDRRRPGREPARRHELRRRAERRPDRATAPAHRLVRELAGRRLRRGRTTCCPTSP